VKKGLVRSQKKKKKKGLVQHSSVITSAPQFKGGTDPLMPTFVFSPVEDSMEINKIKLYKA
jgi:hypothetical protein